MSRTSPRDRFRSGESCVFLCDVGEGDSEGSEGQWNQQGVGHSRFWGSSASGS